MNIIFTKHAEKRLKERDIKKEHVLQLGGYRLFKEFDKMLLISIKLNEDSTYEAYICEDLSEYFYSCFKVWEYKKLRNQRRRML